MSAEREEAAGSDRLADRILEKFRGAVKPIPIPELDTVVYAKPYTIAELKKIERLSGGGRLDTLVYTLIEKALDENGDRVFSVKDKPEIENYLPSDVLSRIVGEMNDPRGFENAVKN